MPRAPRPVVPGQPLHIVQRGVNRAACFESGDDFRYYRHVLHAVSDREGCEVQAYVLMTNHLHLLVTAIRQATNTGTILATTNCRAQIEAALRQRLTRFAHGGDRRSPGFQAAADGGEEPPHRNHFSTMLTP